jgi:hypothetical protein
LQVELGGDGLSIALFAFGLPHIKSSIPEKFKIFLPEWIS